MDKPDFTHLITACTTNEQRAELAILLAHASTGIAWFLKYEPGQRSDLLPFLLAIKETCESIECDP